MDSNQKIDFMLAYAMQFIGAPYIWGQMDCSGFVQEIISCIGEQSKFDKNAQGLYDNLKHSWKNTLQKGSVLFFGKSITEISHVAIALSPETMIESGGGDHTTTTEFVAKRRMAMVRIRPIRKDLVARLRLIA